MKELTNEQYKEIGAAVISAYLKFEKTLTDAGRAAYAASFPYAIADALRDPSDTPTERDQQGIWVKDKDEIRRFIRHRLAAMTAKPDPAMEALRDELRRQAHRAGQLLATGIDYAALVAAVDAARAAK